MFWVFNARLGQKSLILLVKQFFFINDFEYEIQFNCVNGDDDEDDDDGFCFCM